jgi:hypothetical protein
MSEHSRARPIELDWRCLLGFDQATRPEHGDGIRHSAKVGDKFNATDNASIAALGTKDARGFSAYGIGELGAKIGPKEARGFGAVALGAKIGVKIGFKEGIGRETAMRRLTQLADSGTKI